MCIQSFSGYAYCVQTSPIGHAGTHHTQLIIRQILSLAQSSSINNEGSVTCCVCVSDAWYTIDASLVHTNQGNFQFSLLRSLQLPFKVQVGLVYALT